MIIFPYLWSVMELTRRLLVSGPYESKIALHDHNKWMFPFQQRRKWISADLVNCTTAWCKSTFRADGFWSKNVKITVTWFMALGLFKALLILHLSSNVHFWTTNNFQMNMAQYAFKDYHHHYRWEIYLIATQAHHLLPMRAWAVVPTQTQFG